MHNISRRQFFQAAAVTSGGLLLASCVSDLVGAASEPLNQKFEELLLKPETPVPEFAPSQIDPANKLIVNTYGFTPQIDPAQYRLIIDGEVAQPLSLSLAEIHKLPLTSMIIRHVCVEGWATIVHWGGVRLSELIRLAQPKSSVRYVYFESADRYLESWDLRSCLHPQTLMAYQRNGEPIAIENGAPLRLAAPIKLGYKQSKWVTRITLVSQLGRSRGYWEDQGYEWFAGL